MAEDVEVPENELEVSEDSDTTLTIYPTEDITDTNEHTSEQESDITPPPDTKAIIPDDIKQYTDEEAFAVLEQDGTLDAKRLSSTHKLIQKSFESQTTKKWQEIADTKRQLEAQQAEPKNIFEAFDRDPIGVKKRLNELIFQKEMEDPFSEEAIKFKKVKGDLEIHDIETRRAKQVSDDTIYRNNILVRNAIPDFNDAKSKTLTEFAIKEMGFTEEDLIKDTHPNQGEKAVRAVLAIHKMYERLNAGKTAESKAVKPNAPALGRAGASSNSGNTGKIFSKHELGKMMTNDPAKYESMQPEIMKAYADGRVR